MQRSRLSRCASVAALALCAISSPRAQESDPKLTGIDFILDAYVRDGEVYYRALKSDRARLDTYVASLATAPVGQQPRDAQLAFWLNAYNTIVLRTVIDHYPIHARSADYPAKSIRQIPGAFDRLPHRVAGKTVTLDQIEQTVLPEFHDPRVYFALGRGAIGSGRLRSEPFTGTKLETQLTEAANECITRAQCVHIAREANKIEANAIFSWREQEFAAAYASGAISTFANRSPIERAILAFVSPKLLTTEREFLAANTFQVVYKPFDWTLNDLTGRGGR
jgi:Protein of unknown function, DUF547